MRSQSSGQGVLITKHKQQQLTNDGDVHGVAHTLHGVPEHGLSAVAVDPCLESASGVPHVDGALDTGPNSVGATMALMASGEPSPYSTNNLLIQPYNNSNYLRNAYTFVNGHSSPTSQQHHTFGPLSDHDNVQDDEGDNELSSATAGAKMAKDPRALALMAAGQSAAAAAGPGPQTMLMRDSPSPESDGGGPDGSGQYRSMRLPPILQVEKQHVTTTATQAASATRRKNEAVFKCPVPGCGSTFTRRFNLRGHLRSHTEERPFVCDWPGCGKGFARSHDCKRHSALHTAKQGTHVCPGCNKTFSRTDALNRHMKSEVGSSCRAAVASQRTESTPPVNGDAVMPSPGAMDVRDRKSVV